MNKMDPEEVETLKKAIEKTDILFSIFINNPLNYDMLFDFLIRSNNYERQIIAEEYRIKYNKTVFEEINNLISDKDTKNIVSLMFYSYYELDARALHKAFKDKKKDEKAIVEIFASRPHWFLQIIDGEYYRIYGISLKGDLEKEKKSDFKAFLQCMLSTPRNTNNKIKTQKQAIEAAEEIIKNGLKKYGSDVELFKNLFVKSSKEDLI